MASAKNSWPCCLAKRASACFCNSSWLTGLVLEQGGIRAVKRMAWLAAVGALDGTQKHESFCTPVFPALRRSSGGVAACRSSRVEDRRVARRQLLRDIFWTLCGFEECFADCQMWACLVFAESFARLRPVVSTRSKRATRAASYSGGRNGETERTLPSDQAVACQLSFFCPRSYFLYIYIFCLSHASLRSEICAGKLATYQLKDSALISTRWGEVFRNLVLKPLQLSPPGFLGTTMSKTVKDFHSFTSPRIENKEMQTWQP